MNYHLNRNVFVWIEIAFLVLLLISSAQAEPGFSADPTSLNITAYPSNVTRTVLISANENLTNLSFTSQDMIASEGTGVIFSQSIQAVPDDISIVNGSIQKVLIIFDMSDAENGLYSGEVVFSSPGSGTVKIPLTATVKDDYLWPLVILFLAVILSYLLFSYSSDWKKRDEILINLKLLEKRVDQDTELKEPTYQYGERETRPNPYYPQITSYINTARYNVDSNLIGDADTFLKKAQELWNNWKTNQPELGPLFKNFDTLMTVINALETNIPTSGAKSIPALTAMRKDLQSNFDNITSDKSPKNLRDAYEKNYSYCENISQIHSSLRALIKICDETPNTECKKKVCDHLLTYKNRLEILQIDEISGLLTTITEAQQTCQPTVTLKQTPPLPGTWITLPRPEGKLKGIFNLISHIFWPPVRLWLYNFGIFVVMVVVLALIGFLQLYVSNPTFGSLEDYVTLALWGLLVGPTGDAISTKAKGSIGL